MTFISEYVFHGQKWKNHLSGQDAEWESAAFWMRWIRERRQWRRPRGSSWTSWILSTSSASVSGGFLLKERQKYYLKSSCIMISEARPVLTRNKAIVERNQRTSQEDLLRFFTISSRFSIFIFQLRLEEGVRNPESQDYFMRFLTTSSRHPQPLLLMIGSILWSTTLLKVLIRREKVNINQTFKGLRSKWSSVCLCPFQSWFSFARAWTVWPFLALDFVVSQVDDLLHTEWKYHCCLNTLSMMVSLGAARAFLKVALLAFGCSI